MEMVRTQLNAILTHQMASSVLPRQSLCRLPGFESSLDALSRKHIDPSIRCVYDTMGEVTGVAKGFININFSLTPETSRRHQAGKYCGHGPNELMKSESRL